MTLQDILVHPKDKQPKEDKAEVIYSVPCKSCNRVYVGGNNWSKVRDQIK